jgi:iron complex outermembrane recepter protein
MIKNTRGFCRKAALTVATMTVICQTPALAQLAAESGAKPQPADEISEIIVTAERRQQSVQDVSADITALSGETLTKFGIEQPIDIARFTPGLTTANATSGGTPIFSIRGIGMDDFNPNNNSGVASYIDDIGVSAPAILGGQLFDIDRVEVLKGPQGTLYGRNATGGAINIISAQPTEKTAGYLNASYGRWETTELNGALSGSVGVNLTDRISGTFVKANEGWQTDILTGRKMAAPDRLGLRDLLKWSPNDKFTSLFNVHYSFDRSISLSPQSDENFGPSAVLNTDSNNPAQVKAGNLLPYRDDSGVGGSMNLTYKADAFTLTSITGYDWYHYISVDNNDGQPGPSFDFFQNDRIAQWYQELRLASTKPAFGTLLDWIAGASYSHDTIDGRDRSDQSSPFVGQFLNPPDFTTSGLSVAQANYLQTRDSYGMFVSTEWHLTEPLSVILGGRYSRDRLAFDGVSTEDGSDNGGILFHGVGAVVAAIDQTFNSDNFSYRAGLNYKLGRELLVYGTVSTGYKVGAIYASPALDPAAWGYVQPETIKAYEFGAKSRLFDGRLTLDAAVFKYDYTNRQSLVTFVSPITGLPVSSLASVPESQVRGFDLETTFLIVKGLQVTAGVSHLNTEITQTLTNVNGAALYGPVPVGSPLSEAPNWTYSARGEYGADLTDDLRGSVQLGFSWTGDQISQLANPGAAYGPYESLSARVGVEYKSGVSFGVWGNNLTNCSAITYANSDFYGGRGIYREQPRSYGVIVGYKF